MPVIEKNYNAFSDIKKYEKVETKIIMSIINTYKLYKKKMSLS